MRDQSFVSPDNIDLTALWAKLRRAAPRLFAISALAGILTYGVLSMMAPRFASQAEFAILAQGTSTSLDELNSPAAGGDTLPSRLDQEAINTHIGALLSRDLAAKVVGKLNLKSYAEFNPSLGPLDTLGAVLYVIGLGGSRPGISDDDVVLNEFLSRLYVFSTGESSVINIRFSSVEPDLAAKVANTLAETYRQELANEANRARAGGIPVEARIVTPARPSSMPVFPRKIRYAVLAMAATLLLGTAVVITAGLATGPRPPSDDEQLLREDIPLVAASSPPPETASTPSPSSLGTVEIAQVHTPHPIPVFRSPVALAAHLMSSASSTQAGLRTMLASEVNPATTAAVAYETAIAMTEAGVHTLLIDGSFNGCIAAELRCPRAPGLSELLSGTARFSDVIRCLPGSDVHVIATGRASAKRGAERDADQLNMILDALDEAYDQIIVVAPVEPARILFETIQGRFDVGIIMEKAGTASVPPRANMGTYLGFVVKDIALLRYDVSPAAARSLSKAATRKLGARGSIPFA